MNQPNPPQDNPNEGGSSPQVRLQHLSARVPENVSRGAFATGAIVMTSPSEFILDFIQSVGQPGQVVARVIIPHAVMSQFVDALRKNLAMYSQRFGNPPELPRSAPARQPSAQEIYDELKLPDELLSGAYANGLMISHTASEFKLDFLANLFPHPSVSCRVFLAAPQVPRVIESLSHTFRQFQQRSTKQQGERGKGPEDPPPPPEPESRPPEDKPE